MENIYVVMQTKLQFGNRQATPYCFCKDMAEALGKAAELQAAQDKMTANFAGTGVKNPDYAFTVATYDVVDVLNRVLGLVKWE